MTMHFRKKLLTVLCVVGITAILIGTLLWGSPAKAPRNALRITEVMSSNVSFLQSDTGEYYDWVEITNVGTAPIELSDVTLTDDPEERDAYAFGNRVLAAGECALVMLTGKPDVKHASYAPFALNDKKDTVYLYRGDTLIDSLTVCEAADDLSFGKMGDEAVWFASPTPAAQNGGICAATVSALRDSCYTGVMISEVCAVSRNSDTAVPTDWVELRNTTDTAITLTGYRLTDDTLQTGYIFPETVLPAHGFLVIPCDEDSDEGAPFSISPYGETLTLFTAEGVVCDFFTSGKQRYGVTCGRSGTDRNSRFYFETPTPAAENGNGLSGYAPMPTVSHVGGYTEKGKTVTLNIPEGCTVYYTMNGRAPTTADTRYNGAPLTLTSTTVLRSVAVRDGWLPSDVMTQTYLTEAPHDLPVISVSGDPTALFGAAGAFVDFQNQNKEVAVHTEYFDEHGSKAVAFESLLKIAGGLSRYNVQKAFSLNLNQTLGRSSVTYPFFETATTETFENLLLRPSGSDWNSAKMRDELVAQALDGVDGFVMQAARPVALYINGSYHGLYYLREKRNEAFVSAETGIPKDKVEIAKTPAQYEKYLPMNEDMKALIQYARTHDLREAEHYRFVTERINEQSLMRYYAVQTWFGNGDVINNTAYYRDTRSGEWNWIVFDADWACTSYYAQSEFIKQLYEGSGQNTYRNYYDPLMTALLSNEAFAAEFLKTYKALMKTTLHPDRLLSIVDALAEEIRTEIPRQAARYGAPQAARWEYQVNYIRSFIRGRETVITKQLCSVFGLSAEQWEAI